MESLQYAFAVSRVAVAGRDQAVVGVVASGNLEILLERRLPADRCVVQIATPIRGFAAVWQAVVEDFVARWPTGGLLISINDAGARPDAVALRLAQGIRRMAGC